MNSPKIRFPWFVPATFVGFLVTVTVGFYLVLKPSHTIALWVISSLAGILVLITIGFVLNSYGHEKRQEPLAKANDFVLSTSRPLVVPVKYDKKPGFFRGLFVSNHGEPAYDVNIPTVMLGRSQLIFNGELPTFTRDDGDCFFDVSIEQSRGISTTGNGLFEEMRAQGLSEVAFNIEYKDRDNRRYGTLCKFERDVGTVGGIRVRYVGQLDGREIPAVAGFHVEADVEHHLRFEVLEVAHGTDLNAEETTLFVNVRVISKKAVSILDINPSIHVSGELQICELLRDLSDWILVHDTPSQLYPYHKLDDVNLEQVSLWGELKSTPLSAEIQTRLAWHKSVRDRRYRSTKYRYKHAFLGRRRWQQKAQVQFSTALANCKG